MAPIVADLLQAGKQAATRSKAAQDAARVTAAAINPQAPLPAATGAQAAPQGPAGTAAGS